MYLNIDIMDVLLNESVLMALAASCAPVSAVLFPGCGRRCAAVAGNPVMAFPETMKCQIIFFISVVGGCASPLRQARLPFVDDGTPGST